MSRYTLLALLLLSALAAAQPPGTVIPAGSQCYRQNSSCANCTGYALETCVWSLTSAPGIQCWPAKYDTTRARWLANTTAYLLAPNATLPIVDRYGCYWHKTAAPTCAATCLARTENSENSQLLTEKVATYRRSELTLASNFNGTAFWGNATARTATAYPFYELVINGGRTSETSGPPTAHVRLAYGAKPTAVAAASPALASHALLLAFDAYFFYAAADYPTGYEPYKKPTPPTFHALNLLQISANASITMNGTTVNNVIFAPADAGADNAFSLTCYWSPQPFYYNAAHLVTPFQVKCDVAGDQLVYPAGTDSVGLRVLSVSNLAVASQNQLQAVAEYAATQQIALGAGTLLWDTTARSTHASPPSIFAVAGHGPGGCTPDAKLDTWLTDAVKAQMTDNLLLPPAQILCSYFSFSTDNAPAFTWDPVIGLDPSAVAADPCPRGRSCDTGMDVLTIVAYVFLGIACAVALIIFVRWYTDPTRGKPRHVPL